jgi:hypothetical protein
VVDLSSRGVSLSDRWYAAYTQVVCSLSRSCVSMLLRLEMLQ